jgi:hypothetical protein
MAQRSEKEIEQRLNELPTEFIALIVSSADVYSVAQEIALKVLISKKGMCGTYVTFNRPYSTLKTAIEEMGLDVSRLFFIDLITESAGGVAQRGSGERCFYVSSPKNLNAAPPKGAEVCVYRFDKHNAHLQRPRHGPEVHTRLDWKDEAAGHNRHNIPA